jgi:hypothetical protein
VSTKWRGSCAVIRDVPEQLPQGLGTELRGAEAKWTTSLASQRNQRKVVRSHSRNAAGMSRARPRRRRVSVRGRRGRSGLTTSPVFHRVPTAPSTELPRLMASQVAVASANVSSVAGRGRNRLGAFSAVSRLGRTRASRRSRGRCSRGGAEPCLVLRDLGVFAAPTRRASRCRRSLPP